jgi:hypothetical protein
MAFPHSSKEHNSLGLRDIAQRVQAPHYVGFAVQAPVCPTTGLALSAPNGLVAPKPFSLARKPLDIDPAPRLEDFFLRAMLESQRPKVEAMEQTDGHAYAAALVDSMSNLGVGQQVTASVQPYLDNYDLFTEANNVLRHYVTFLILNIYHQKPYFRDHPRVQAYMAQAHQGMVIPAPQGNAGPQRVALRQAAVQIVSEVFQHLPFSDFSGTGY